MIDSIIGKTFGRLTVIGISHVDKWRTKKYYCKCICGKITSVYKSSMLNDKTKSCGCLQKEIISNIGRNNKFRRNNKLIKNITSYKNGNTLEYFYTEESLNTKNFIYKITNKINHKIYVGQTRKKLSYLLSRYKKEIKYPNRPIARSIKKYGFDNFIFEILEYDIPEDIINEREIFWISTYNSNKKSIGYNLTDGGCGFSGYKWTEEQKLSVSTACKKRYIDGQKPSFYGMTHSKETIEKIIHSNKRRLGQKTSPMKEETKLKIKESNIGKHNGFNNKKSKFYEIISPCGEKYYICGGFKGFCYEHSIKSAALLVDVANKKRYDYKGWTCKFLNKDEYNEKISAY